jgi:hypothetical protein
MAVMGEGTEAMTVVMVAMMAVGTLEVMGEVTLGVATEEEAILVVVISRADTRADVATDRHLKTYDFAVLDILLRLVLICLALKTARDMHMLQL